MTGLDPDSQIFLDMITSRMPDPMPLDVRVLRLAERAMQPDPEQARQMLESVTDASIPGPAGALPVRWYRPRAAHGGVVLFFHGGGFVLGNLDTHDQLCCHLAAESGCVVVAVEYRLAPEHLFPAAMQDAEAALRWMSAHAAQYQCDPMRLGVAGDSAGGNLAANLALLARDQAGPPIAFQLLLYPLTHRRQRTPSEDQFSDGYLLTERLMRWFRQQHRATESEGFPYNGPYDAADHRHLPPALIITAGCDPLRDQGAEYAMRLRDAAVPVEYRCYQGTLHGFMQHPDRIGQAVTALRHSGAALRKALG